MTKRVVEYARVSTRKQKDNTSLDGQIAAMDEHCREKGYKVVERIKVAHSGRSADLPGIQRLLKIGHDNAADVVVVYMVDRFMRGDDADSDPGVDAAITEKQLNDAGLEVEYLDLPDKDSDAYVYIKTMKRMVASIELRNITIRMMRGRRRRAMEGNVVIHGLPPYGYRITDADGKRTLVIHEPEARVVRLIYRWYLYGDGENGPMTMRGIASKLTEMRVPTWADVHGRKKKREYGEWERTAVGRILSEETYCGRFWYGRSTRPREEWIAVDVPAIVDRGTWKNAQERRKRNKQQAKRNGKREYLLSGRVWCGECANRMLLGAGFFGSDSGHSG